MSTATTALRSAPEGISAPAPSDTPGRRLPRSFGAALLAGVLGALLFMSVLSAVDDRSEVLVLARSVDAGEVVQASDLRSVQVGAEAGVSLVAASARDRVVGRVAAVPLAAGSLLTPTHLGSADELANDQAAVGVLLEPGRFPPGLRGGDRVSAVRAATGALADTGDPVTLATGIVESVDPAASAAGVIVRLRVPAEAAPTVTAESAARRVSLFLLPSATGERRK